MSQGAAKKRTKKKTTAKAPAGARPARAVASTKAVASAKKGAAAGARAATATTKKRAASKGSAGRGASGKAAARGSGGSGGSAGSAGSAGSGVKSRGKKASAGARSMSARERQEAAARVLAVSAAWSLHGDKCQDVRVLDVRGLSSVADYYVLASGTSDRQMRGAAESAAGLARRLGHEVVRQDIDERTTWVVLDCVDVLVHVFEPSTRAHYDLETMWGDAKEVDWRGEPGLAAEGPRAGIRARRVEEPAGEGGAGEA